MKEMERTDCPRCGHDDIHLVWSSSNAESNGDQYYYTCEECGLDSPDAIGENAAAIRWNSFVEEWKRDNPFPKRAGWWWVEGVNQRFCVQVIERDGYLYRVEYEGDKGSPPYFHEGWLCEIPSAEDILFLMGHNKIG